MEPNKKLWLFLAIVSGLLLLTNLYIGYTSNDYNYWGIASNILIGIVMVFNYRAALKAGRKQNS